MMPSAERLRKLARMIVTDREQGVTLWQIILRPLALDVECGIGITAHPETFVPTVAQELDTLNWSERVRRGGVGMLVLPCNFSKLSDDDLAAVVTLPRERMFTMSELKERGVKVTEIPGAEKLFARKRKRGADR